MAAEHHSRTPHPPAFSRQQSSRLKFQERGSLHGRVPVALDDFAYLIARGQATGLDECIGQVLETLSNEMCKNQQQVQHVHHSQNLSFSTQQCPPQAHKHNHTASPSPSSPRRSPARAQIIQSSILAKNGICPATDEAQSNCIFCEAAKNDPEIKLRRERCRFTATMNLVPCDEMSPGAALPMRDAVATCAACNGGVCEAHLMLHSIKMPAHWDEMLFYDSAVDSAYRSLPPQARLLSRIMLSIDTLRKRNAEQKALSHGMSNPYSKNRDVYKLDTEWEGQQFANFEISTFLARSASMIPPVQKTQNDDALSFESKFECGNLARAERIGHSEYVLYMREDINLASPGGREKCYNQWFFFRVDGMQQQRYYTFHICNMYKAKSLFQAGMHVLLRSPESPHWFRGGENYVYKESTFMRKGSKVMHQLTFRLCGSHSSLYVAAAQPYSYTDLTSALDTWENQGQRAKFMKRRTLCKTLAGNVVEVVTITDPDADCNHGTSAASQCLPLQLTGDQRPWIVVCGRVHPSESNSSWFVHGLIDFLTDPDIVAAQQLRRQFVWLVIPMINPDGVICGNSRCNLAGLDLNRCWANPVEGTCPTIYHAKALLQRLCPLAAITLFLDVHGHSRKRGAFIYGNRRPSRSITGQLLPIASAPVGPEVKVPQLFAACSPIFSLQDCSYTISRNKLGTARCVMFNEFQLINSFTLEISMFAAASLVESTLVSANSQSVNSSARPLAFREEIHGELEGTGCSTKNMVPCSIPQHLETEDFMRLSRDFATCLIASNLSWMADQSSCIMKMVSSSSFCANDAIRGKDEPDCATSTGWSPEREQAIQWLWSRGINILGVEEQQSNSRLLHECKSTRGVIEVTSDLPNIPTNPSCLAIMKLLFETARANQELQGEAPSTRSSVQSCILHQLRTQVNQMEIVHFNAALRAAADWLGFVIKSNKVNPSTVTTVRDIDANLDCTSPGMADCPSAIDVASLFAVQSRINDALRRLHRLHTGDIIQNVPSIPKAIRPVDDTSIEPKPQEAKELVSMVTAKSKPSPQEPSSLSHLTGVFPQQLDSIVKPWSFSFVSPDDALNNSLPTSNATPSLDSPAQISGTNSLVGRIRQRVLVNKGGFTGDRRMDTDHTNKAEITANAAAAPNFVHIVTLDAAPNSPIHSSQPCAHSSALSSVRRIRVAGAVPFPLQQQHQLSQFHKKQAAELQHRRNGRSAMFSGLSSRSQMPCNVVAAAVTRSMEFSITSGIFGSSENLWSVPSVGGTAEDEDVRKAKGSLGIGEILVLKQPTVTTVQPFENEKPLQHQSSKKALRPSTYR